MSTVRGVMTTDRPERYAKQLTGHWSRHGPTRVEDGAWVQRWTTGEVLRLQPAEHSLLVEVTVTDGQDAIAFAAVVKAHLERFGHREELDLVWLGD